MTTNNHIWPNPERPGEPLQPTQTGPHALIEQSGKKVWAWWMSHPSESGIWMVANQNSFQGGPSALIHEGFKYLGPAVHPE